MLNSWHRAALVVCCVLQLAPVSLARDEDLKCGVCRAAVNEINLSIRSVDPKKTVQVGGFRVDSRGNQPIKTIPLARAESHLSEQLEKLCTERIQQWGVAVQKATGRRAVIRKYSLEGSLVDTPSMKLDETAHKRLVSVCHDFLEEHEEDAIPIFQVENSTNEYHEKELCIKLLGLCTEAEAEFQKDLQSSGIREAIMSNSQGKDTLNVSPGGGIVKDLPEEDEELGEDEEGEVEQGGAEDEAEGKDEL